MITFNSFVELGIGISVTIKRYLSIITKCARISSELICGETSLLAG